MNDVKRYDRNGMECGAGYSHMRFVLASDYDALAQRCLELEEERAEQWRLRRDAEADRDTDRAVVRELQAERDTLRAEVERLCAERDQLDRIARHLVRAYIIDDQAYDPEKATNARLASYKERFK